MVMRHVIVGNGPAGVIAAENLRRQDSEADIVLIGKESEPPYSRMAIPYFLVEKVDDAGTHLRHSARHFDDLKVDLRQAQVTKVKTKESQVQLDSGDLLNYDSLLLATGSRPVVPPVTGMDLPSVSHCWTLDDARKIVSFAKKGSDVVLIGAGFIGCIILEALVARGVNLHVVEMEDRMVPRMMDQVAGNLIKSWCEATGVKVYTSTRVDAVEPVGKGCHVMLQGVKQPIKADLVIVATGVVANVDFLEGSGIEVDQGILVNDTLQTSVTNVYAAGDVCQGKDFSTGEYSVQAIQPTAADHGRIAASNMQGGLLRHRGSINMNVLDTIGLVATSFGLWQGVADGESAKLEDVPNYRYLQLQFQDDRLIGAQAVGHIQHIGVLRGLIQTEVHLGSWKAKLMQDPTRYMEAYLATTQPIGFNGGLFRAAS